VTCHDARELFSDWTDGVLSPGERALVDAHLAECADCRKELDRFRATVALLQQLERPRAPAAFVDRVLAAARPGPWYRRLLDRLFLPLTVKLPAEVAALLLVAGLAVFIVERTPESMFRNVPPDTDRDELLMHERVVRRAPAEDLRTSRPAPAPQPPVAPGSRTGQPARPTFEFRKEASSRGGAAPEQTASSGRPTPEEGSKIAPAAPPAPALRDQGALDAMRAAKAQRLAAPSTPEGKTESEAQKTPGSLPHTDVVGRLTVKDRSAAQEALIALLDRSRGVVVSRRTDGGTTSLVVAVPRTAYLEFSQGLARLGAWHSEGEPSELPPDVRVLVRLVE
jgi:hypothetical protein